jgi:tripartite-type tricarboxylate transporter receptor subunit TctC
MLLATALVTALAGLTPASAQQFPGGRTITTIVPVPPGGGTDQLARAMAPVLGKILGTTVQVVNKPGASMQTGTHEVAFSKPDGTTLLWIVLPTAAAYLDPDRQSTYTRANLQPIGSAFEVAPAIAVKADSKYKTLKDLIDDAKANPSKLKAGTAGLLTTSHLASIGFQRSVGIKFANVNFTGGAQQLTALLGGHIDVAFNSIGEVIVPARGGQVKVLGVMADGAHMSGMPTINSQGFNAETLSIDIGLVGPAGMPADVVQKLADALKQATEDPSIKKLGEEQTTSVRFLGPDDYKKTWDQIEARYKPLIDLAKQDSK